MIALPIILACALAAPRVIVAANNVGGPLDLPLKFAEADASALADALVELGAADRSEIDLLLSASKKEVLAHLANAKSKDEPVIVFLSSHGDGAGAHLEGEVLAWSELSSAIKAIEAKTVVAFVDACQSGALLTPKGFKRGPPLSVIVRPEHVEGRVLITSSGANEISNESILLQGSPFAQSLLTALRGGADADADGRVTVEETYDYLYGRTVAATIAAPAGPQHPARAIELRGTGAVVLTEPKRGARVFRTSDVLGACYVLDAAEARILAELPAGDDRARTLPLGEHVVKCVAGDKLKIARVELQRGDLSLDRLTFKDSPLVFALAKGPERTASSRVTVAGAVATDAEKDAHPALALRYRRGSRVLGWNLQLVTSPSDGFLRGIVALGGGYVLPFWGGPDARIELGLSIGARFGDALGADRPAFLGGQYASIDFALAKNIAISGRFDLETAIERDRTYVFFVFSLGVSHDFE